MVAKNFINGVVRDSSINDYIWVFTQFLGCSVCQISGGLNGNIAVLRTAIGEIATHKTINQLHSVHYHCFGTLVPLLGP